MKTTMYILCRSPYVYMAGKCQQTQNVITILLNCCDTTQCCDNIGIIIRIYNGGKK